MSGRRIELRIDELVLSGFDAVDGRSVAAAARRELERLAGEDREWRPRSAPLVRGAPIALGAGAEPRALGRAIARSVYRGLES